MSAKKTPETSGKPPLQVKKWPVRQAARPAGKAKPPAPPPPTRRTRLSSIEDIAQQMRRLYRDARSGLLVTGDASRLCFILHTLAGLVEVVGIERRIKTLEEKTNGIENRKPALRSVV
jgi:hypothetical protein